MIEDKDPEFMTSPLIVLVVFLAVIVPKESTEKLVPSITLVPGLVPIVSIPVPLADRERLLFKVEGEMVGADPENTKEEEVKVLVFMVPSTTKLPLAERLPLFEIVTPLWLYPPPISRLLSTDTSPPLNWN